MTKPLGRIIVADRYAAVRRGVRIMIEALDCYRVVGEASNGREVLDLARDADPHIIVLDHALPELSGPGLIQQLRRTCPRAEILVYTDTAQEELALEMLRHGARGFVFKTDSDRHFVAALDALLERRPFFSQSISESLLNEFLRSDCEPGRRILTFREREIVQLIAEGYLNKQIAEKLCISVKTVETHRSSTMSKLKIRTTADLVRYAVRNHITQA